MSRKKEKQVDNYTLSKYCKELFPILESTVDKLGFHLFELSFVKENNTNYLRLTIKHSEHEISLDDCELVSKQVEKELDSRDLIPFPYTLEVQSPGINKSKEIKKDEHEFILENLGLTVKS